MDFGMINELNENDVITLTPEWLSDEYDRLNTAVFDGKMGKCSFGLFTTGRGSEGGVLGWFKITGSGIYVSKSTRRMYTKDAWGEKTPITKDNFFEVCKPRIELNGNYTWTRKAAMSTLVHEMCHYYCNMNGWRPVQHHGNEFRSIAFKVSQRSNEFFSVERIAKAEQMDQMELNSVFAEKKKRRMEAKVSRLFIVLVYMKNGEVRLVNANGMPLVRQIMEIEKNDGRCKTIMVSQDSDLVGCLFENGYKHEMRTYRYWDITTKPIREKIEKYNFKTIFEDGNIMESDIRKMVRKCLFLLESFRRRTM